jgi:hypothetical protein
MHKVHKPNDSECYSTPSEPSRYYILYFLNYEKRFERDRHIIYHIDESFLKYFPKAVEATGHAACYLLNINDLSAARTSTQSSFTARTENKTNLNSTSTDGFERR